MPSVGAGDQVGGPGSSGEAHRHRLLSLGGVGGAMHHTLGKQPLYPILECADLHHPLIASHPVGGEGLAAFHLRSVAHQAVLPSPTHHGSGARPVANS